MIDAALANVAEAAVRAASAQRRLEGAILEAREQGASLRAISRAAGLSHEQIRNVIRRNGPDPGSRDAGLQRRLDEIEARWDRLVEAKFRARWDYSVYAPEQRYRNGQARKRRNRGLPALPTVQSEVRAAVEAELLEELERLRGTDPRVDRLNAELDEAWNIRQRLEATGERRAGF